MEFINNKSQLDYGFVTIALQDYYCVHCIDPIPLQHILAFQELVIDLQKAIA